MKPSEFFDLSEFRHAGLFEGVENVWDALSAVRKYLGGLGGREILGEVAPGAIIEGDVRIGRGTVVEPTAYIKGPAVIGENCEVRHGAYIRGNLVAGDDCIIGHTTEVKNAIFLNGAKAAHFAYIGDSILGAGVNLGAGTKLANFKIQAGSPFITVETPGGAVETRMRKLGAILGDGVEIGCNAVTAPGTLVGRGAMIYACSSVRGYIYPRTMMKMKMVFDAIERKD